MAISLISALTVDGHAALAERAATRLVQMLGAVAEDERGPLAASPAVRMALFGLRHTAQHCGGAAAERVLAEFPQAVRAMPPPARVQVGGDTALVPRTGVAAFHDILVVVYSCRANLETRIPAIRAAWLDRLAALGIPHVIVVGGGDGRREGDVVHLDAPDSYEGLPAKTLAMVDWVARNTSFAHLFKVDDDCFLDVERAIGGMGYRRFPYFGRRLFRRPGVTDRTWHHTRGVSGPAADEIDKSPEPSEYADGGSGYALNRRAMQAAVQGMRSARGAWLRMVSFNEDKLLGDMLALGGVRVASRDYHVAVFRRGAPDAPPTGRWENAFLPSAATPALLAHLDATGMQEEAARVRETATLRPLQVWPTFAPARVGFNRLNLELVSSPDRLEAVNAHDVCVIGCVRNEAAMLPLFLDHYRRLGVRGFLMVDNCSDDATLPYLLDQPDVAAFASDTAYALTEYGVAWQQALMANFRAGRWSLVADADEFLVLPRGVPDLTALVASDAFAAADVARVFMLDLYPRGPLSGATLAGGDPFAELDHCEAEPFRDAWSSGPYTNDRTWTSALRHRLLAGARRELFVAQKYALVRYRPWLRFTAGLHYVAEGTVAGRDLMFAHFKYHAAFHARARAESRRRQHFNGAEEYRRYLALMSEGQDVLFDERVSVPWRSCGWVRRTLDL